MNSIKSHLLQTLLAITALLFSPVVGAPAEEPAQPGRFQLIAATVWDEGQQRDVKRIFKLDTATGKTWEFETLPCKGSSGEKSSITGWSECHDNVLEVILKLQAKKDK